MNAGSLLNQDPEEVKEGNVISVEKGDIFRKTAEIDLCLKVADQAPLTPERKEARRRQERSVLVNRDQDPEAKVEVEADPKAAKAEAVEARKRMDTERSQRKKIMRKFRINIWKLL